MAFVGQFWAGQQRTSLGRAPRVRSSGSFVGRERLCVVSTVRSQSLGGRTMERMEVSGVQLRIANSKECLSQELAEFVVEKATAAKTARGKFTVAVSGGSLPKLLAMDLTREGTADRANFPVWHVYFADERCVPLDDADSNYLLTKQELFSKASIPSDQIFPIDPNLDPADCADNYAELLKKNFSEPIPEFDMVLLGMGPDGHTCSLFPDHALLQEKNKTVASLKDSPKPPPARITLTYPVLNAAREVVFVTTGSGKKDAIKSILTVMRPSRTARNSWGRTSLVERRSRGSLASERCGVNGQDSGEIKGPGSLPVSPLSFADNGRQDPESKLPAALVKPTSGEVTWFIDHEAAGALLSV